MTDSPDKPNTPDTSARLDELLTTVRAALASDAGTDARAAGTLACRAILAALDPSIRTSDSAASNPSAGAAFAASSPIAMLLAALGQTSGGTTQAPAVPMQGLVGALSKIPREQLANLVGGLRWLFGGEGPKYLPRPAAPPSPSPGGGQP